MISFLLQGGRSKEFNSKSKIYEVFKGKSILYVPFANKNYQQGFLNFKKYIPQDTKVILATLDNFKDMVEVSDVIFLAGGIYEDLYSIFIDNGFDLVLKNYQNSDKIYAGVSAGAILLSRFGVCDKNIFIENGTYYNFNIGKGLGFLNIAICPHYERPGVEYFVEKLKELDCDSYLLEDDVSIYFKDNKIEIIKDVNNKAIYKYDSLDDYTLVPLYERSI